MTEIREIDHYLKRLAEYLGHEDPVAMQQVTARTLERLINGVPESVLRSKPEPQKCSVVEILARLAEDELVTSWRYRQMIEHSGTNMTSFNQDEWARLGDYGSWEVRAALKMFRLLREANLRLLTRLTSQEWHCDGIHPELGLMTVMDLARHRAAEDIHHMLQIEWILSASPATEERSLPATGYSETGSAP